MNERKRILVQGVVQGIGFRPFVYQLARELKLTGWVRNDTDGATMEIQGSSVSFDDFLKRLGEDLPPAGRIDRTSAHALSLDVLEKEFQIKKSVFSDSHSVSLAPDRSTCAQCIAEIRTQTERRFQYPFTNCTHCGPRYTIVHALPYDRCNTTMSSFPLCTDCQGEYENPEDRRYHAEPVACPQCGPHCLLVEPHTKSHAISFTDIRDSQPHISRAISLIKEGQTVAVKGIGGFHLVADAACESAITRFRQLKHRSRKPLAIMVKDLQSARKNVRLDSLSEDLLISPAAPIVVAAREESCTLPHSIAPGLNELGVMLPYSPLHHLLFDEGLETLIVTSGNCPSQPITTDNQHAVESLNADAYLLHNRDIHVPSDDSVVRGGSPSPVFLRRARGYVPDTIDASQLPNRQILSVGAELKVTIATIKDGRLSVGRHLGDINNSLVEDSFIAEIDRILTFGKVQPEAVAVDAHPDIFSAVYARQTFSSLPVYRVQHHHGHFAAVLCEHKFKMDQEAVGIVLDGFGYGLDDTLWGGEVLLGHIGRSRRVGHIRPFPQPGGDRGALEPGRMATSLLRESNLEDQWPGFDQQIASICRVRSVSPLTSSAGRLFDAAAALIGVAPKEQEYEGEAASLLETIASPKCHDAYPFPIVDNQLDFRVLIQALMEDKDDAPLRSARFHNGLADGFVNMALDTGADTVVLSGGCMANRVLMNRFVKKITENGARAIWPIVLPPGDGGLSAGQAACALWRLETGD